MVEIIKFKIRNELIPVELDSEKVYPGQALSSDRNEDEDEKIIRRALKFPITKGLVYYPDKHNGETRVDIREYKIEKIYTDTDPWCILKITTENGDVVGIHSMFLAEMQKTTFIADMKKQEALQE